MVKSKNVPSDCFANQKLFLNCFGLLHNHKVYTISLLILLTIYILSVIPEIVKVYYVDLKKFISFLGFESGLLTCLLFMYVIFLKRFEFELIFEKLQLLEELSNFTDAVGENDFVKHYKDVVRKQVYFGVSWITFLQVSFISMSVVLSLNEEKWILPFGSRSTIINNDNIQFIIQIIMICILLTFAYLLLIIYINVLTLICGHCKLLQNYIALSFIDYQGEIFKELDVQLLEKKIPSWKSFQEQLRHIVPYHVGIIDAAKEIDTVFSYINLIFFVGMIIFLCISLYHTQLTIEIMETVQDVFILISGYSLMIIISGYGEKLATESSKIASVCYEIDFVGSDLRIQKSLILIMAIPQRPITPTIGKFKVLGLPTMISIFQSMYSYYTILRNVMQ